MDFNQPMLRDYVRRKIAENNKKISSLCYKAKVAHGVVYNKINDNFSKGVNSANAMLSEIYLHMERNSTKQFSPYNYFDLNTLISFDRYLTRIVETAIPNSKSNRQPVILPEDIDKAINNSMMWLISERNNELSGYYEINKPLGILTYDERYLMPEKTLSPDAFSRKYNEQVCQNQLEEYMNVRRQTMTNSGHSMQMASHSFDNNQVKSEFFDVKDNHSSEKSRQKVDQIEDNQLYLYDVVNNHPIAPVDHDDSHEKDIASTCPKDSHEKAEYMANFMEYLNSHESIVYKGKKYHIIYTSDYRSEDDYPIRYITAQYSDAFLLGYFDSNNKPFYGNLTSLDGRAYVDKQDSGVQLVRKSKPIKDYKSSSKENIDRVQQKDCEEDIQIYL